MSPFASNSRGMLVSFSLGDLDSFDKMEADSARFDSLNIEDEVRKAFQNYHPFPNGTIVEGPDIDRCILRCDAAGRNGDNCGCRGDVFAATN